MIARIAGYGLAADRRWTAVPEGDLKNVPGIRSFSSDNVSPARILRT